MVGAAIGVKELDVLRAQMLVDAGVDFLVVDIAHGGLDFVSQMLQRLKVQEKIAIPIIGGNVADAESAKEIVDNGGDAVKVGIGAGLTCETRDVAGVGVPQVTAIMEVRQAIGGGIPLISDGGVRKPKDVGTALAAGADTVMIGSYLAGTDKSPGEVIFRADGRQEKMVRGMASASAFQERQDLAEQMGEEIDTEGDDYIPEGRVIFTAYQGPESTRRRVHQLARAVRSTMSYIGAHTINEMPDRTRFYLVSAAGASEQKRPLGT